MLKRLKGLLLNSPDDKNKHDDEQKKEAKKKRKLHKGDQNESKREAYYSKLGINPGLVEDDETNYNELNWNDDYTKPALKGHSKEPVRKDDYLEPAGKVGYETVTIMGNHKDMMDHYKSLKSDVADNQKGQLLNTNIPKKQIPKEEKLPKASPMDISMSKSVETDDFHWTEHVGDIAFSFESEIGDVFDTGHKNYTDAEETNQTFSSLDKKDRSLDGTLTKETLKTNECKYEKLQMSTFMNISLKFIKRYIVTLVSPSGSVTVRDDSIYIRLGSESISEISRKFISASTSVVFYPQLKVEAIILSMSVHPSFH